MIIEIKRPHLTMGAIAIFLEMLLLMPYPYLTTLPGANVVLNAGRFIAVVFEIIYWITNRNRYSNSKYYRCFDVASIGIFLFYFAQAIITIIQKPELWFSSIINIVMILMFILCMNRTLKDQFKNTINAIAVYFSVGIIINAISVILFPNGLYLDNSEANIHICYFLGVDNQFGRFIIPGVAIIWFVDTIKENRLTLRTLILLAISIFTYLKVWSVTGLIVILVFLALFILYYGRWTKKALSWKTMLLALAGLFFIVVLQYGATSYNGFSTIILEITGKNATFSGRSFIWAEALKMIADKPIFGYGKSINDASVMFRGFHFSCHNIILQYLIDSGVFGLVLFLFPIMYTMITTYKIANDNKEIRIIYVGIFVSLSYFFMEVGSIIGLLALLLIGAIYCCNVIMTQNI